MFNTAIILVMYEFNGWIIAGIAVFWVGMCFFPAIWRSSITHVVTLFHEAGHAIIGLLVGRGVHHIKIQRDTSGETMDGGRRAWLPFGHILALLAGYPFPILMGAFLLGALNTPFLPTALWVMTAIGIFTLLFIRNFFGLLITVLWITIMALIATINPHSNNIFIPLLAILLIVGGCRDLFGLIKMYFQGESGDTDLGILQAATLIPKTLSLLAIIGISGWGGWMMFIVISQIA